jgi:3,4-dihydroxy 2-butanone 4-phosphate synthase/GTP cyclohydrolase II
VLGKTPSVPRAATPGALRDFGLGAQVLADLGLHRIRLLSNNPKRIAGLGGYSIDVVERVPFEVPSSASVVPLKKVGE